MRIPTDACVCYISAFFDRGVALDSDALRATREDVPESGVPTTYPFGVPNLGHYTTMVREDADELPLDAGDNRPPIQCEDCQSVLHATGTESVAFLLVDQHTIPLASCPVHREQFRSICELTTEGSAELLEFRPAGGVPCQPCRLATHNPTQPIVPVTDGAVLVLACPRHQTQVIDRFYTGLQTQQELTTSLDSL